VRTVLRILNEEIAVDGGPAELRRLLDLAATLEERTLGKGEAGRPHQRLILAALALLDEAQTANAALARAHCEIDRLNDIIADAAPLPLDTRGRVNVLRA